MRPVPRIFLLSPARCGGRRTEVLVSPRATFPLAAQLRSPGAPLGDVMTFLSGLYFRGKLAYARAFARPPRRVAAATGGGVLVITPHAGLVPAETLVTADILAAAARVDIAANNPGYREPLAADCRALAANLGKTCDVVLLGSIASAKYVDVLDAIFGDRLRFPLEFVGRGDMSRGGLMLRCAREGRELTYVPVRGAVRHGARPPKLPPLRYAAP